MAVNLLSPLAVPLMLAAVPHLVVAALLPVHLVVLVVADEAVPFRQSGPESRVSFTFVISRSVHASVKLDVKIYVHRSSSAWK